MAPLVNNIAQLHYAAPMAKFHYTVIATSTILYLRSNEICRRLVLRGIYCAVVRAEVKFTR